MRISTGLLLAACFTLSACLDPSGVAERKGNETKAMSLLKQWQVAEALYLIEGFEGGSYGSLEQLSTASGADLLDDETYNAWDGGPSRKPVSGYLFSEIRTEHDKRAGLCAYPAEPGRSGQLIFLLLIHSLDPADWAYYVAPYERIGAPVTSWPSSGELSRYERITPGTPQQGFDRVHEMFGRD